MGEMARLKEAGTGPIPGFFPVKNGMSAWDTGTPVKSAVSYAVLHVLISASAVDPTWCRAPKKCEMDE